MAMRVEATFRAVMVVTVRCIADHKERCLCVCEVHDHNHTTPGAYLNYCRESVSRMICIIAGQQEEEAKDACRLDYYIILLYRMICMHHIRAEDLTRTFDPKT